MPIEESLSGMEYLCVVGVHAGGGDNIIVPVMQSTRHTKKPVTVTVTV